MVSSVKPTVVLLQGSWQSPELYYSFAKLMASHGFPVVQPSYPSLNQDDADFTKKTLNDDTETVENAIKKLVDEDKTVLLFMHSYGGIVGAESVPEDLTFEKRKERGLSGGVAHLFYLAAFVLPFDQSIATAVGDQPNHDTWDGRFMPNDSKDTMYSDLAPEEAAHWAGKVTPQSKAITETPMRRCAYSYVPSTYVVCTEDKALPPPVQEMFAQLAGATIKKLNTGHSAMLNKADEVLTLFEEAVL